VIILFNVLNVYLHIEDQTECTVTVFGNGNLVARWSYSNLCISETYNCKWWPI